MDTYGQHIIAEFSECENILFYDNGDNITNLMLDTAREANAKVISYHTHKFSPQGISAITFLEESHIAIHIFSESKYIAFDVSTCGNSTNVLAGMEFFGKKVGARSTKYTLIERGLPDGNGLFTHKILD